MNEADPAGFSGFVDSVLERIPLSTRARAEWSDELMSHFEFADSDRGPLTDEAIRDLVASFGPEEELAENIRIAEADASIWRDPSCLRALFWTLETGALGWICLHAAFVLIALSFGQNALDRIMPLGRFALWMLPAVSATIGYTLLIRNNGNPHRILSFVYAALCIFLATLFVHCRPEVITTLPAANWHLFVTLQFPVPDISTGGLSLNTAVFDLDYSGGLPVCRPRSFFSTVGTPLQAISSARFSILFLVTWIATLVFIRRGSRRAF